MAIRKSGLRAERAHVFQLDIVKQLLFACCGYAVDLSWGMLDLFAYVLMLRLPAETIPVVRRCIGSANNDSHSSVFHLDGEHLCLKLKKKKIKVGAAC